MADYQKIIIKGNVGQEPDMQFTPSGSAVTKFSVAVNRAYTANGEQKKETEWFNVVVFGKQAESCNQYLNKGSTVLIEGRQHTNKWDGPDGQKHSRPELIASQVCFLDKKQTENGKVPEEDPADIPF